MRDRIQAVSHFVHAHFLWLLIGSYAVAAVVPGPGLGIRSLSFGAVAVAGQRTTLTLPVVLLAFLIFNAGLGVRSSELRGLVRAPLPLALGLAANLLVPVAFIFAVAQTMQLWHNADEVQNILVGLALVASMPIAGSSTAWAQNANGDLALSLGLVLLSTLFSPLTTPVALHAVGWMAAGEYAENLHSLATGETGSFLVVSVVMPCIAGLVVRQVAGGARVEAVRPALRLLNTAALLVLNYANAAVSLPQAIAHPDWDFLAAILVVVIGLCTLAFASGAVVGWATGTGPTRRASLMFGLGMNNNGTGLVLASMALADHPDVLLPIIFYNLFQHLAAGCVDYLLSRSAPEETV
ncbi:bile acid:sodium symporter family protein [Fimbriiglobus ruber]|uniref:Bile acid:sodium symporter n=1 Tax=Fimbriiglobus ruber TaxID=1908690 RepID=A0A225E3V9_9BACT|nr:bile acid:sodium symporter [Fimbriiglobus ruber]OWK46444.1 Bile acid:sodium symporter [Fimbriiglobus ruber]